MDAPISPEQYRRVFEAMPGAFLLLLPDAGFTIADVSDAYLHATLRQRAELIGRPVFDVFPDNPDTPEANSTLNLSRSLQRVIDSGKPDVMAVQRYDVRRADGQGFEMRFWSPANAPVFAADGRLLCIVHRVDNVTDYVKLSEAHAHQVSVTASLTADKTRMEAEIVARSQELELLNNELREANHGLTEHALRGVEDARRKDEFLAMLAHELRNPLSAMSSALQLWTMYPADQRRQHGLIDICKRQVGNLTRLVDDLLEMSRIDHGAVQLQRAPLDLRDVAESALHGTRELRERRQLSVSTRIAPANFHVFGDSTRLEQALTNLLTNAAKYSEPGGNVELRLESAGPDRARIEVRDEGRGIPPDKLDAIFDIFVQVDVSLDRSRGGLGIGLALVRSIVDLHGGRVSAHSDGIGHGSRFVIELPLLAGSDRPAPATDGAMLPPAVAAAPGAGQSVVLVEDNADTRDTMRSLLAAYGYTVKAAATGPEGVACVVETRPDLAIVDIGLPGLDGFEVARRVRAALGPDLALVALTGYNSTDMRAATREAGFDLHVTKPCTPDKLADIVALLAAR